MSKPFSIIAAALLVAATCASAQAPAPADKAHAAATRSASDRYRADLKLCDDETSSSARLRCRRDAKDEYDRTLADARARKSAAVAGAAPAARPAASAACPECGIVMEIAMAEKAGEGSAAGLIAGGLGGALLGHQIGGGSGRDVATIAGAVGGAYAGKKIEEKIKTRKVWTVGVQYASGSTSKFEFDKDPGFKVGDRVRNLDKTIVRQ